MSNQCGCNHWAKPVCPEKNCGWREWKAAQAMAIASKPAREWVGLTDEEITDIWRQSGHMTVVEVARAVEAKLREKNNG